VLEVLYHRAKFGGVRISSAAEAAKTLSFFLSVCLSVRHAFERQDFAIKALEHRNDFDTVSYIGRFAVFNFLRLLPTGDTTKCRSPKNGKNWVFRQPRATE